MNEVVLSALRETFDFVQSEAKLMPLGRWNESVFRYFFCRALAESHPDVAQLVECDRIDLVLRRGPESAFIEFKFYLHPQRFDPYEGSSLGFKGGPSPKNLREFQSCLDQLHARQSLDTLSKYVVLVYGDPCTEGSTAARYSHSYDDYRHLTEGVLLRRLEALGPIEVDDHVLHAHLYEVE